MGLVLWMVCGVAAFLVARIVPPGRPSGWIVEAVVGIVAALALGVLATFLDFGGWREPDWRAGLFIVFGSFAAIGLSRLLLRLRRKQTAW